LPKIPEKLTGNALVAALVRTQAAGHHVKIFHIGERVPTRMNPANAFLLLKSGTWHGFGTSQRVKIMRAYDPRPAAPWLECWRTSQACVLPAWTSQ
jgi:hypothetical protein